MGYLLSDTDQVLVTYADTPLLRSGVAARPVHQASAQGRGPVDPHGGRRGPGRGLRPSRARGRADRCGRRGRRPDGRARGHPGGERRRLRRRPRPVPGHAGDDGGGRGASADRPRPPGHRLRRAGAQLPDPRPGRDPGDQHPRRSWRWPPTSSSSACSSRARTPTRRSCSARAAGVRSSARGTPWPTSAGSARRSPTRRSAPSWTRADRGRRGPPVPVAGLGDRGSRGVRGQQHPGRPAARRRPDPAGHVRRPAPGRRLRRDHHLQPQPARVERDEGVPGRRLAAAGRGDRPLPGRGERDDGRRRDHPGHRPGPTRRAWWWSVPADQCPTWMRSRRSSTSTAPRRRPARDRRPDVRHQPADARDDPQRHAGAHRVHPRRPQPAVRRRSRRRPTWSGCRR